MDSDLPPTLYGHIRDAIADGMDDSEQITARVIDELSDEEQENWLHRLVGYEVNRIRRRATRQREIKVRTDIAAGADPTHARRTLMNDSFVLPDGRWVMWLEATADDHLARAGWLRSQEESIRETRVMHEQAARLITEAGVRCLADLDPTIREQVLA